MAAKLPGVQLVGRLAAISSGNCGGRLVGIQQRRSIVNKHIFKLPEGYKDPWPYKEKGYRRWWHWPYDFTRTRLHQNSKLIVVEGNIGAGKSTAAPELADTLGFLHMPEFKMDDVLIDRYGNDLRDYYHLLPPSERIPDINMFYKDPMHDNVARMQFRMAWCRFEQYLNAVAHILNTGQGVVLERSFHTDFVFTNTMRNKNYISPQFFKLYYYIRKKAIPNLRFWPHLVVYLDASVDKCRERIRARGNADEAAVVDGDYLKVIEDSYKDALKEFERHSKILIYDWNKPGSVDQIIEDIESMDFDYFEWHEGEVFQEWHLPADDVWLSMYRENVTLKANATAKTFDNLPVEEVGELFTSIADAGHLLNVLKREVLGGRYGHGFYPEKGDDVSGTKWLWKHDEMVAPWYEYYWRDIYMHGIWSYESLLDPYAQSYNPEYNAHH